MAKLTQEKTQEIINLYLSGISVRSIAKLGFNRGTVQRVLRINNIIIKPSIRKYWIDENFLDNIDTEEKAYFLGWMWSDGTVGERDNVFTIQIKGSDKLILETFSQYFYHNKDHSKIYASDKFKDGYYCSLSVYSKKLKNRLIELGCHPNKTFTLKFPNELPNNLQKHFIRGIFDGDGCLYKVNNDFSIIGTNEVLIEIAKIFEENLEVKSSIYCINEEDKNTYKLNIRTYEGIKLVLDWLYNGSTICLERKRNIYFEFLKRYQIFITGDYPYLIEKRIKIKERRIKVLELKSQGLGSRKIAKILNVNRSTILNDYKALGIYDNQRTPN